MFWTIIFLAAVLLLTLKYVSSRKNSPSGHFPPGPKGVPLLGNVLQIVKDPHLKLSSWTKDYGNVYTISLAGKKAVVASDVKSMRGLFGSLAATGRFESAVIDMIYLGNHGLGNSEGNVWQEQQRFCIQTLKHFGFGDGNRLDSDILRQCDYLCDWIANEVKNGPGSPVHLDKIFVAATGNLAWNLITGDNLSTGAGKSEIVDCLLEVIDSLNTVTKSGLAFFSWLKYLAPEKSGYNYFTKACQKLHAVADKYFQEHRATRKAGHPRDVIDMYLDRMESCSDPHSSFFGEEGRINSLSTVVALLVAGAETTASTLRWLVFYLALNPQVQNKLQAEIDEKVGKHGNPSLLEKQRLPYLEAVCYEILRITSLLPFGVIHRCSEDIEYKSYRLPKGTLLMANLYHANHDPKVWKDPENFRPERFLEGDAEQQAKLRDSVVSFQEGRRRCTGELLAKDMLFLFSARLTQKFSFYPDENLEKKEYLKPMKGMLLVPQHLGILIQQRV